jgi:hypothetical protein
MGQGGQGGGRDSGNTHLYDGSTVINEGLGAASVHLQPIQVDNILHTNGAGDALCGGIISELVHRASIAQTSTSPLSPLGLGSMSPLLPDIECIRKGLLNAHAWLVSEWM